MEKVYVVELSSGTDAYGPYETFTERLGIFAKRNDAFKCVIEHVKEHLKLKSPEIEDFLVTLVEKMEYSYEWEENHIDYDITYYVSEEDVL